MTWRVRGCDSVRGVQRDGVNHPATHSVAHGHCVGYRAVQVAERGDARRRRLRRRRRVQPMPRRPRVRHRGRSSSGACASFARTFTGGTSPHHGSHSRQHEHAGELPRAHTHTRTHTHTHARTHTRTHTHTTGVQICDEIPPRCGGRTCLSETGRTEEEEKREGRSGQMRGGGRWTSENAMGLGVSGGLDVFRRYKVWQLTPSPTWLDLSRQRSFTG
jgi:hypothetical protein